MLFAVIVILLVFAGTFFLVKKDKTSKTEKSGDVIRIGYNAESPTNASVIIAYEKKYFEKYGLKPEMTALKSGKEVVQAMVADQVDVGLGGLTNFMPAMVKGAPLKFIAASASSPSYVFIRPNEDINKISDLYGRNVSLSLKGINELMFKSALEKEGLDAGKINYLEIERAYNVAALMEKKAADAAVVSDNDTEAFKKAGAVLLPEWQSKGYDKKALPRNSIAAREEFLNQHDNVVEKFLLACADAHLLIKKSPEEAAEIVAKHIKEKSDGAVTHDPDKLAEQWKGKIIENMIWQDPEITMALAEKAEEIGIVEKGLTLEQTFDLRFAEKLEAIQNDIYGQEN